MQQIEADRQREIAEILRKRHCSPDSRVDCSKDCECCSLYYEDYTR